MGQNFLTNEAVLDRIADAVISGYEGSEIGILEIGSGPGGLTESLAQRSPNVVGVEIDEALCEVARHRLKDYMGVSIIPTSILGADPSELMYSTGYSGDYLACGNLPYYITQPVIRILLTAKPAPRRIVTLVQREVARRIAGGVGKESLLSLSVKIYGEPEFLFEVDPSMFWPQPKVHSAVLSINKRDKLEIDILETEIPRFIRMLQAGFGQPRKQLHNGISGSLGIPHTDVTKLLAKIGISTNLRPQHLDISDWVDIYHTIEESDDTLLDIQNGDS